jgi:hypothetical protein
MSDNCMVIYSVKEVANPIEIVNVTLKWLQQKQVIETELTDCVMNHNKLGYRPSINYSNSVKYDEDIKRLTVCGLEIKTEREIYKRMEFSPATALHCPICNDNRFEGITPFQYYQDLLPPEPLIAFHEVQDAFNEWLDHKKAKLKCHKCNQDNLIEDYKFEADVSFSNLGFKFWNWAEFNDDFFFELEKNIGVTLKVAHEHF